MKKITIDGVEYNLTPVEKNKSIVEWLKMLPEPYSSMAIIQIDNKYRYYNEFPESIKQSVFRFNEWHETIEGHEFWSSVYFAINEDNTIDHSELPPIPVEKKEVFIKKMNGIRLMKINNVKNIFKTKLIDMEKVIRDGKVAVLISPGYGAGWYSWNRKYEELLFSPKIVEMVEQNRAREIDKNWVLENLGIADVYCGGVSDLMIFWIDTGTAFSVEEHDGFERLLTLSDLTIIA